MALTDFLTSIADAIRYAEQSNAPINAQQFATRIRALSGGQPIPPTPPFRPDVPQSGTWQMKTTYPNGFVLVGKDDDTTDQAIFVRMVSGYGFPVTINTSYGSQHDMSSHKQRSDADTEMSLFPSGSISRFPDGCSTHDLNIAIIENDLGEVAQHGSSRHSLWDSTKITEEQFDYIYNNYVEKGGTRTRDDFFNQLKIDEGDSDVSQGASYVHTSRTNLENDLGYPIFTLGTWGSSDYFTVDDIEVCNRSYLSIGGSSEYAREWNYWGDGKVTAYSKYSGNSPWNVTRLSDGFQRDKVRTYLEKIYTDGSCAELFGHLMIHGDGTTEEWEDFKYALDSIKEYVDAGKIQVVTRYQYSQLGEFVTNPIKSLSVTRNGSINVGDTDSDSAYIVTVTYADGSSETPSGDMILDRSGVDTSQSGTYTVYAMYRGFKVSCQVNVLSSSVVYPDGLKAYDSWFVYSNDSQGLWCCGNSSKEITEAFENSSGALAFRITEKNGKINGWTSTDQGATWTQVTTNRTMYGTAIATTKTSDTDGGYQFSPDSAYHNKCTLIDSSGNFEWNYPYA